MQTDFVKSKVLYLDDEEENLLVFKSSFRRNFDVYTSLNHKEATTLLSNHNFDVIISDQRMPDITGVEFLKNLPSELKSVKIILSGYTDAEALVEALNSDKIDKYITKPWKKDELQLIIAEAICKNKVKYAKQSLGILVEPNLSKNEIGSNNTTKIGKNDELELRLEEAYKNVKLLGDIGQEILHNLTPQSIISCAYDFVNSLMEAPFFSIAIHSQEENSLIFLGGMENGLEIPPHKLSLDVKDKPAVWAFKNNKEFFTNDYVADFNKYFKGKPKVMYGDFCHSIIYLPLLQKGNIMGVITVQSTNKNAYTNYHLDVIRNIGLFTATALENAKAYHLIELQKAEIENINTDLEIKVNQRTRELQIKTEEIELKKNELESTYNKVKLLSEIGQQITSSLSLEKIIETVYENVNRLMDATIFSVGVFNKNNEQIEFRGAMENGEKLPPFNYNLHDENRLAIWCFKNAKELIINDYQIEYQKYIKNIGKTIVGEKPESIVYLPLITNEGVIGTISVQSFKKHIYNTYHIDILRTLASYVTIAIQNANSFNSMQDAFAQLKSAQSKLVESEKMASLGVLTAGVAHEINNPVNFISAGINSLNENYQEIKETVIFLAENKMQLNNSEIISELVKKIEKLELDILLPEIDELIKSIKNGASRTTEIVIGLRNFSRLDETDKKKVKVEEGLDSTLVILNNQIKNKIEVIKVYTDTPEIKCYPGQLNQVFMNIINNAIDAMAGNGKLIITTKARNKNVTISIKDNGKGMPKDVCSKIFEPFFTTKAVGKGTGLGLSISYGIIEKHNGTIEVISEEGKGTEFIITLPINN